ncbi:efflux RND transporter permease subunit [Ferrimonas sp. SCSIO 43195]|uniref:efflux RND transporter permease subunit n=1 Tax=Ferrimonas sp. SCSIO 43195 TaxID=2822844 RepID=UPI00207576E2|nr:efflux RND transporter permease subunit [Ferrimonas sp. SCSIO 43195]USD38782.1 efflux RND transporter permease subunit [Ferrimonas sp. SCSIO 43195]
MGIINTSVKRPVTVWMFILAVVMFGLVGFSRLAVNLLPDMSYPTLTVRTQYAGAAPAEVEQLVSKPIEEAIGVVKGLRKVSSTSRAGLSDVLLEFEWGTDMDLAALDSREKLDAIQLPLDVDKPLILRFNPNLDPIVRLAVTAEDSAQANLVTLRTWVEEELKRTLETVPGVASVRPSGGLEQQVQILIDQQKMAQLGLSVEQLIERIRNENINLSAGKLTEGDQELLIRTLNQFQNLDELRQLIVYRDGQRQVRLFEIAEVQDSFKERDNISRSAGQEAVELAIYKEGDANTVAVAQALKRKLEQLQPDSRYPITLLYDQSRFIESAVSEVTSAALIGSVLAMVVIFLFLGELKPTLIISLSIPVSVIATFNLMYFAGISLNIMSLGGIALAVGLLVDNAIVVLENIDRRRALGDDLQQAARTGTEEVSGAIIASTLTTLAVFVPLIFVDGIAGQLFADQAMTVAFALIASLLVALSAIPMLSSRKGITLRPPAPTAPKPRADTRLGLVRQRAATVFSFPFVLLFSYLPNLLIALVLMLSRLLRRVARLLFTPILWAFNALYAGLTWCYPRMLRLAMSARWLTLALAIAITGFAVTLVPKLGMELIPPMNQGEFYLEVQLPPGTEVGHTDRVLDHLATAIVDDADVEQVYSQAGSGGLLSSASQIGGENWGRLQVVLANAGAQPRIMAQLRAVASRIPDLEYTAQSPELFSFKTPMELEISGYDLQQLKQASLMVAQVLGQSGRFKDVQNSLKEGQPELTVRFDHSKLATLGLTAPNVANRVASVIGGSVASRYTVRDRKIDILVRALPNQRDQMDDLASLIVNPGSEHPIALSAVANISEEIGPAAINRIAQQRVAIVSANLSFGSLKEAVADATALLQQLQLPAGTSIQFGGQNEEMEHSVNSLYIALALAVFLVYLVMASQFESLLHPLLILVAVPMALAGSVYGLWLTGTHISVIVFIGLIMLAGIVVNNAIVLVDRINQLRGSGLDKAQAIQDAAHSRLRPILMTTLTTTLGLAPMMIGLGDGAEMRAPMAITVIAGLLLSTLLTLVVLPVLYSLFDNKHFATEAAHDQ